MATSLALYRLRVLHRVREPCFGDGSTVVLHPPVSHALAVPDAALGAPGYLSDIVLDTVAGDDRWRPGGV